ncbi:MAG: phosphatase PAP2 family protein [Candidatus Delongbacteria bacterium]|nr:phosphatase PAP2 family protein [Candidatus Delongbacteria bacterium]
MRGNPLSPVIRLTPVMVWLLILFRIESPASDFPYRLNTLDYALLSGGIGSECLALYLDNRHFEISREELAGLSRSDINPLDRWSTRNWDPDFGRISDILAGGLLTTPGAIWLAQSRHRNWRELATYSIMFLETVALTNGLKDLTKALVKRKRPYLYNSDLSEIQRMELIEDDQGNNSFFSGHTANAFSASVFLAVTYRDLYGDNPCGKLIWITGLSAAGATGFCRYHSGNHFPTDILAGAAVGSAIGYAIPALHRRKSTAQGFQLSVFPGRMDLMILF